MKAIKLILAACAATILAAPIASGAVVFVETFDDGDISDWTGSCIRQDHPFDPEPCGQAVDGNLFTSGPFSARLFGHGSCFSPPFSGVGSVLTRIINLPNGDYTLSAQVRHETTLYGFCIGGTGGSGSIDVNGSVTGGNGCGVGGSCGTCTADWVELTTTFTVTAGTATITLVGSGGDCDDHRSWFDDIVITSDDCDPCVLTNLLAPVLPGGGPLSSTAPCFGTPVPSPPPAECCTELYLVVPPASLSSTHPCFLPPPAPQMSAAEGELAPAPVRSRARPLGGRR